MIQKNKADVLSTALIQQRKKISLEAFDSLFYSFSNAFFLDKTLKGYDPIAVDGSYIYVDEMYGQYVGLLINERLFFYFSYTS